MSLPKLSRRLTLEGPQNVADGAGGFNRLFMPLGEIWADIRPKTGRSTGKGTAPISEVAVEMIVRAAPVGSLTRPKPEQRYREDTRVYRILSVTEWDARGMYLSCEAVEEIAP